MKVTVVPAQVTTVEDRIMGNLSFSQMLLFVAPIFLSAGLFALLPPIMSGSIYKYVVTAIIALTFFTMAIRIKGKIVAYWVVVILRFNLRPKYYLFNKNTILHREQYESTLEESAETVNERTVSSEPLQRLKFKETAAVMSAIENPLSSLSFETTKKGGLHVRLTEVQEQS